jgi:hypothetical protein
MNIKIETMDQGFNIINFMNNYPTLIGHFYKLCGFTHQSYFLKQHE